ncbi:MAG: hypothetical protein KatS3mg079_517 [Caloramator sp.]|nr:MAG: hypothetical protein KatS3mg079_517 [Caloramator sp.]
MVFQLELLLERKLKDGIVEFKLRNSSEVIDIKVDDVYNRVLEVIKEIK